MMSYQKEREEFIVKATSEGLSLDTCRKLLRYATMLQRLAEAQCNGDWPYNGDRDRPSINEFTGNMVRLKWDAQYTTCPKCEASGVAKSAMRRSTDSTDKVRAICPDCRIQELVRALLAQANEDHVIQLVRARSHEATCDNPYKPIFQGDPRGAVLRLETPNYPYSDDERRGRGLYVPARTR